MPRFSIERLTYTEACQCIDNLKANGIEANISAGCVSVQLNTVEQVKIAQKIVSDLDGYLMAGSAMRQEDVILRGSKVGVDALVKSTNTAMALLIEANSSAIAPTA